ncbi:MAG: hypothetical protein HUU46_09350 [Candidatus Hydrogenedentes bacterium]|nr:hypothetical protein [Candidatus Hydrogenedentota bacterium]
MNRMRASVLVSGWILCILVAAAQEPTSAPLPPTPDQTAVPSQAIAPEPAAAAPPPEPPSAPPEPEKSDPAAQMYMLKCAGCHTIGGGQLSGPDLRPVQTWPRQNVDPAIQRMEKNVGPLKPEDVALLTELLQAPDAAGRLADERKRISLKELAKLAPANAEAGEAIFFGRMPLSNRGLSCASCHAVGGRGGNLASDLTGSFAKMGEVPLGSAIEGVTFPLMKAAYADKAITKQETIHLVKYLETAGKQVGEPARVPPLHAIGTVGAVVSVIGLTQHFRKRNRGVRKTLVRNAMRRSRS